MSIKSVGAVDTVAVQFQGISVTSAVAEVGKDQYVDASQEGEMPFTTKFNKGQWGYNFAPMYRDYDRDRPERSGSSDRGSSEKSEGRDKNTGNGNGNKVGSDNKVEIKEVNIIKVGGCGLIRD